MFPGDRAEGRAGQEGEVTKGHGKSLGHDGYVHCLDFGGSFTGIYTLKLVKLYTVNIYSLLYANYIFFKTLLKNIHTPNTQNQNLQG